MLKITMGFYLIPFAWYKFLLLGKFYKMFPQLENPFFKKVATIDLTETILLVNNEVQSVPVRIKMMWGLVFMFAAMSIILVYFQLNKYFKLKRDCFNQGISELSVKEKQSVQHIIEELGIKKEVRILYSDLCDAPFTIGAFHPTIMMPDILKEQMDKSDWEAIITHELYHIKHNDVVFRFLALLMIAIHWYNPISYLFYRELCNVSELFCDYCTTKNMSIDQRDRYSNLIVEMATETREKTEGKYVVQLVNSDIRIIERRILELKKHGTTKHVCLSVMIGAVICLTGGITSFAYHPPEVYNATEAFDSENTEIIFRHSSCTDVQIEVMPYDYFWTDQDGNITEMEEGNSEQKASCVHNFESGTVTKHTRYSNHSCKVVEKNAQKCTLCNISNEGSIIQTITYQVCPH